MKCPWCGEEVSVEKYAEHLEYCKKYPPHYEAIKERARIKHSSNPGETENKPTLEELFKGKVLNGYLEASRVRTLEQFMPFTFLFDEGLPTEEKITVNAVNEFEASIKARDEFTKRRETYHKTSRLVGSHSIPEKSITWHGASYYAYGSWARPLEWLIIQSAITSVPHTSLTRLSRGVDYAGDEPYFNILLSPQPLKTDEIKSLELVPLEKMWQT